MNFVGFLLCYKITLQALLISLFQFVYLEFSAIELDPVPLFEEYYAIVSE